MKKKNAKKPKWTVVPKEKRIKMPAEAFLDKSSKVRITMYVDLDVLNYFKARAEENSTGYQTEMNAAMRDTVAAHQAGTLDEELQKAQTALDNVKRAAANAGVVLAVGGGRS